MTTKGEIVLNGAEGANCLCSESLRQKDFCLTHLWRELFRATHEDILRDGEETFWL